MTNTSTTQKKNEESKYYLASGSDWLELKDTVHGVSNEPWDEIWVENDYIKFIREQNGIFVNDAFIPLWDKTTGILFLDGGYGSSKTTYAITRLLVKCLENKYFRCFYGRDKKTEARNLHSNIITEIKRNNWEHLFKYSEEANGNTRILCKANGNKFELFGCDDVESLKGIDNPSDILVDEINQISWEAFGMLFTRLRTPGIETQLIGCFNNCDVYPDHWLVKYIYNPDDSLGDDVLLKSLEKVGIVKHHSTYLDNKFQNPDKYYNQLVVKAKGEDALIKAYCNGEWGIKLNAQPYYKMYKKDKHVVDVSYNPDLDLHLSWDDNLNPYMPCLIIQVDGKNINVIDEIAGENPNNSVFAVCGEIMKRYGDHKKEVFIYGDATAIKDTTVREDKKDIYQLMGDYLAKLKPQFRVPTINPSNKMRGDFVNTVLNLEYEGLRIRVAPRCEHMKTDFQHCMESANKEKSGHKDKTRVTVNGIPGVQKYGHFGDCFDYFICMHFQYIYLMFQHGGMTHPVTGGGRTVGNADEPEFVRPVKVEDTKEQERWREFEESLNYKRESRNGY